MDKRKKKRSYKSFLGPDVPDDEEEPRSSRHRNEQRLRVPNHPTAVTSHPSASAISTVETASCGSLRHQSQSSSTTSCHSSALSRLETIHEGSAASGHDCDAATIDFVSSLNTPLTCSSGLVSVDQLSQPSSFTVMNVLVPQSRSMACAPEETVSCGSLQPQSQSLSLPSPTESRSNIHSVSTTSCHLSAASRSAETVSCGSLQPQSQSLSLPPPTGSRSNIHSVSTTSCHLSAASRSANSVACASLCEPLSPSDPFAACDDVSSRHSSDDESSLEIFGQEEMEVHSSSGEEDNQQQPEDVLDEFREHQVDANLPEPAEAPQPEGEQPLGGENEPPPNENPDQHVAGNLNLAPAINPQPGHQKLRRKMEGDFRPIIDVEVNVSRNDALYMALGLAKRENFSNSTMSNAVKLINALFSAPILPATVDGLDGLLLSQQYVRYFFYCTNCMKPFGELDYKNVKNHICPRCGTVNVISDLRKSQFFVMFSIPHQLENLLQNPEIRNALLTPAEAVASGTAGFISDLWNGSVYKLFAAAVLNLLGHIFSFHFCVDGSPTASTSLFSIWPIQLAVNELPAKLRMCNLLLAGLWFGKKQARMDLFLEPFVDQFISLSQGFNIRIGDNIERCYGFCVGCCVDSGARGKVQGIKTHSGYYSCNWCIVRGLWIGGAVRFPLTEEHPRTRTHEEMERAQRTLVDNPLPDEDDEEEYDEDPGVPDAERDLLGVKTVSPLINLPHFRDPDTGRTFPSFHMIDGFYVDSMHMLDLGIGKVFTARWMEDYGYEYYIKGSEAEINRRIKLLQPPVDLRRLPRILDERARFTAREWHNWSMIFLVPVLTGILPNRYLNLWLLLQQAHYFLNQKKVNIDHANIAGRLIDLFLARTQELYDEGDMLFNLHILGHIQAHVLRHGPLWASNAYCFEDGNGILKRLLHSNQGVPHQIIRALCWTEAMKVLESVVSEKAKRYVRDINTPKQHGKRSFTVGNIRVVGKEEALNLSEEEEYQCTTFGHDQENLERYPKILYENCCYTDNLASRSIRHDNSVAQLCDKSLVLIRKIIFDSMQNVVFLLVSDILFETVLVPPAGLRIERNDHFMRKINHINEEVRYIKCSDLSIVCFRANLPHGDFVAPLPNVHNRQ